MGALLGLWGLFSRAATVVPYLRLSFSRLSPSKHLCSCSATWGVHVKLLISLIGWSIGGCSLPVEGEHDVKTGGRRM